MRSLVPLIASLSVSLLSGGCTNDPVDGPTVDKQTITLSLGTYAVNNDPNANSNEVAITSAYVYIFNAGGYLENADEVEVPLNTTTGEVVDAANNLNRTWSVPRGRKNIYVLLNPGTLLLDDNSQPNLANYDFTEEELLSLRNDPSSFDTDFSAASASMLMSGMVQVEVSTASQTVNVPVARRYAAIDLRIRKKSDISDVSIIFNKATLVSQNTCDYAFAEQGNFRELRQVVSSKATSLLTSYKSIANHYSMPQTGLSAPVRIDLDITYNGKDMTLPVYINKGALNGNTNNDPTKPLDIEANNIYMVDVTITQQNIDVAVNILDWSDRSANGDIYGASLSVTNDRCLIYEGGIPRVTGWAGDTYTVAEANYVYDGAVPDGVTNSITVEGTDISLECADKLTADRTPVRVLVGPTFKQGTVTLKFGPITKTVKIVMIGALDAHFGFVIDEGQATGSEWIRNDNFCSVQNHENNMNFLVCVPENVTPTGWIHYDHAQGTSTPSNAGDADAEPLFEEKKAEGIIYRSDLGATKVFIRQLAPMYLGHFGSPVTTGDLTATDAGGYGKKRMIVEVLEEVGSSAWASTSASYYHSMDEFDEGREIAEYLKDNVDADAVRHCLMKNDRNGNNVIDPDEPIEWYLPAMRELYGVWIGYEPMRLSNYPFDSNFYWSSTETMSYQGLGVRFDATGANYYSITSIYRYRCVRSL